MEVSEIVGLADLLRQHGDKILNGSHQLTLTATLLQYLNIAFCMVVEHDITSSFQVINTTTTKLHELHFLHDFVQKVEGLVISHGASTLKGNVDISKFRNLRHLELRRVPLHIVSGLSIVQQHLKTIVISQSLSKPSDLLGEANGTLLSLPWPELYKLSLPQNTLYALDFSFKLAMSLKEIDLSHNQLSDVMELEVLPNLTIVNLSYNRLSNIPRFHPLASSNVKVLSMAHNQLDSLSGLEILSSVQVVHVGWNYLLEASLLAPLSRLSLLRQLWLEGNPCSRHIYSRQQTAKHLHPCISSAPKFMLNGIALSEQEKRWVGAACLGLSASLSTRYDDNTSETANQKSLQQRTRNRESRRCARVREALISNEDEVISSTVNTSLPSENVANLETKHHIESLRKKLGDKWLAGMPGALGLPTDSETISDGYQCHEAEAWLESQQQPPRIIHSVSSHGPEIQQNHSENNAQSSQLQAEEDEYMNDDKTDDPNIVNNFVIDNQESADEEDEEGSDPPYLVQRKMDINGQTVTDDYFFIVGPRMLVERETTGKCKIITRWPANILQSCEHTSLCQVTLTFNTVRTNNQKREYILETTEVQRLCHSLGSRLESRSLRDMNQVTFHCMKCSTKFSTEMTGAAGELSHCPSCKSTVVVQEDAEWPTESHVGAYPKSARLVHSNSHSSIGTATAASTSKVLVAADVHPCTPSTKNTTINTVNTPKKKCSAASLDQSVGDSGFGLTGGRSRLAEGAESDIEVISNPSQSSIEILPTTDDNHRERSVGASTDSSQPPNTNQSKNSHGLTESSSSGSMTDSVCTAYESGNINVAASLPQPSSSLSGVLGSFLQRFTPVISQQLSSSPTQQPKDSHQHVRYNYSDFTRVDHRLKLHLCMHVLNHENEMLIALLRCWVLSPNSATGVPYSGLLVISNEALYLLRIQGIENENPDQWLTSDGSWPISQLQSLSFCLWQYGIQAEIQISDNKVQNYTFIIGDKRHASGFLSYISDVMPVICQIQRSDTGDIVFTNDCLPQITEDKTTYFAVVSNFLPSEKIDRNTAYGPVALIISDSVIAVSNEDMRLKSDSNVWILQKPITNLMDVEISLVAPWLLRLHFTEENGESIQSKAVKINKNGDEGPVEEVWTLWFVSQRSRLGVIEALRAPWQKVFDVPLDVREV